MYLHRILYYYVGTNKQRMEYVRLRFSFGIFHEVKMLCDPLIIIRVVFESANIFILHGLRP